jgi:type VI secretion system protein ImpE
VPAGRGVRNRARVPGCLNDERFEWLADVDSRLGPVLEAVVNNTYYWIPIERIQRLAVRKPADLRDLVWAVAELKWDNGGEALGLIPTRYAGTEQCNDDRLRLARLTEWSETANGCTIGHGQRTFTTETGEYGLLDIRELALTVPP